MSTTRREAIALTLAAAIGAALAQPGIDPNAERWVNCQDGTRAWLGPVRADGSREIRIYGIEVMGQRCTVVLPNTYPTKRGGWEWTYERTMEERITFGDPDAYL